LAVKIVGDEIEQKPSCIDLKKNEKADGAPYF